MTEIKFCGLTRAEDTLRAVALGIGYAGAVFAESPRRVGMERARAVFSPLRSTAVRRVGVFGPMPVEEIVTIARECALDVLQLAGEAANACVLLRSQFDGALWPVVHSPHPGRSLVATALDYFRDGADAIVFDAKADGQLGGTGVTLDWTALAPTVQALRGHGRVVLAGGLHSENVSQAIGSVRPDVVDVSSGIESAPGIKDVDRMRGFVAAVRSPR